MPSVEWMLLYILLGFFVGFMAGLLGVGGGGILVPLLVSVFSSQGVGADNVVHLALGTTLACTIISSIASIRALAAVGGVFLALTYLSYQNVEMKKAIGTSSAIGFPIAIAGTVGYMMSGWSQTLSLPYTIGFIYVPAFLVIAIASSIAAPYGARYSHRLPETHLKKIFAVLSLILSIKMLFSVV